MLLEGTTFVHASGGSDIPTEILLTQNYPNPFNPSTKIVYGISKECEVRLTVFDLLGREVALLVDGPRRPGWYETEFRAYGLPSGVYLYRLEGEGTLQIRKMVLLK